jgi:hypothetical protein
MNDAARIPQEVIDKARAVDIAALAARYGFRGTASSTGEEVGPCPGCGGTDRFSVNARKNVWRCRQGGGDPIGGDAVALVRHVEDCGFRKAVETLTGGTITVREHQAPAAAETNQFREKERSRAYAIWREAKPFARDGHVAGYLSGRAIDPALARLPGAHCREHEQLSFWHYVDTGRKDPAGKPIKDWRIIHRGPAMLWPIVGRDGRFLGVHSTWLEPGAPKGKAEIFAPDSGEQLSAKKVRGSKKGGRIVLCDMIRSEPAMASGEGVESVLSWRIVHPDFPGSLETSVDLGNLAGRAARTFAHPILKMTRRDGRQMPIRVPGPDPKPDEDQSELWAPRAGVERLTLVGDGDSDPIVTQAAMARAKARLVEHTPLGADEIAIDWPPAGFDFNSYLMRQRGL